MTSGRKVVAGLAVASASLVAFVANWEGSETRVYRDMVGIPTVCNGHTGPDVKVGDVWTKPQCDAILVKDVTKHGRAVLSCVKVPVNQHQYEAFASLAFNIGPGAFCTSTLVRKANAGDFAGACREILRWNRAGGRVVQGLANRRQAEFEKCIEPMPLPAAPAREVA